MSVFHRMLVAAALALCAGAALASRSIAPPSLDDETTQTNQDSGGTHVSMAIWLPTEMFSQDAGDLDPALVKQVGEALKGYVIIGIADVNVSASDGHVKPVDLAAMRASARLRLGDRAPRPILQGKDLPPAVGAAADVFKKMMANMIGKFGDSMEFVVFNDADEHGVSLADPHGSGTVTLAFDKESFVWRLPLVSVLPLRVDRATGDTFPGDYEFSPFTGHKLETK